MNRHAEWLLEDLERIRTIHNDLTVQADVAGDHRLANIHRTWREAYSVAIAYVSDALPKIIAEAEAPETPEPDITVVFGPLASHSETLA